MQIIIDETEIQAALDAYCTDRVKIPEGQKIKVTFTAGRGENGAKATIDFEDIVKPTDGIIPTEPVKVPKKTVVEKEVEVPKELPKEDVTVPETPVSSPSDELFKLSLPDDDEGKPKDEPEGNGLFKF